MQRRRARLRRVGFTHLPLTRRPGRALRNASVTRPAALNWTPIRVPTGDCEKVGSAEPRRQRLGAIESASTVAAPGGLPAGPPTVTRTVATSDSDVLSLALEGERVLALEVGVRRVDDLVLVVDGAEHAVGGRRASSTLTSSGSVWNGSGTSAQTSWIGRTS